VDDLGADPRYSRGLQELVRTAAGEVHREDVARGRTGGPAGNARLTSWTGLALLALLAVEGFTVLSLGSMLGLHIWVGALLVPPVLLKSATTGWRIVRYYTGDADYVRAGPPPLLLRLLGPLVIVTSLAVLGTGLGLVLMGSDSFRSLGGPRLTMVTAHKASFILWFAVMTLHVLARTVPALRVLSAREPGEPRTAGGPARLGVLAGVMAVGVILAIVVLNASTFWTVTWRQFR
jgi:hypothetical protein